MVPVLMVAVVGAVGGAGPLAAQQITIGGDVNHALPSPPPTDWNVGGELGIGMDHAGEMHISGGSTVSSEGTNVLGYWEGSSGLVTVDGKGSVWTTTGNDSDSYFAVGMYGNGTLKITNGGAVYCNGLGPGYYYNHSYVGSEAGSTALVIVDGEGSTWGNSGNLYVGNVGNGTLNITDGGTVYNQHGIVGQFYTDFGDGNVAHGTGIVNVDGAGSTWTNNGTLTVGSTAEGTVNITNGGAVSSINGNIGGQVSSLTGLRGQGTVNVDGKNSTWTDSNTLTIGSYGDGILNISNGGSVSNVDGHIARYDGSTGSVTVSGKNSTWTNSSTLTVGENGNATLAITNGGTVSNTTGTIGKEQDAGGSVTVSGNDSRWINTGSLYVGHSGNGTLKISNGATVSNNYDGVIGYENGSVGKVIVDGYGSTWTSTALTVGLRGSGELTITNGGRVNSTTGYIGRAANGTGKITVSGAGSMWSTVGDIQVGYNGSKSGELHIKKGGIVNVGGSYFQNKNGLLELDIGSLGSCKVTAEDYVFLDGILQITTNGWLDEYYYVLIDNLGDFDVFGKFADIFFNGEQVTLTLMDDMHGGGWFVVDGIDYYISYAGDSATGSLYGGNDVILSHTGGPNVPEPASLSILGLGAAALIVRRRK